MKASMEEGMKRRLGDRKKGRCYKQNTNMAKKRNSGEKYATHLQIKVIQALFRTIKNSCIQKTT